MGSPESPNEPPLRGLRLVIAALRAPGETGLLAAVAAAIGLFAGADLLARPIRVAFPTALGMHDLRGVFLLHGLAFLAGTALVERALARIPGSRRLSVGERVVEALAFLPIAWVLWDVLPGPVRSRMHDGEITAALDGLYFACALFVSPWVLAGAVRRRLPIGDAWTLSAIPRAFLPFGVFLTRWFEVDPEQHLLLLASWGLLAMGLSLGGAVQRAWEAAPVPQEEGLAERLLRRLSRFGFGPVAVGLFLSLFVCSDAGWRLPALSALLPLRELASLAGAPLGRLVAAQGEGRIVSAWASDALVFQVNSVVYVRCGADCGWVVPGSERVQAWAAHRADGLSTSWMPWGLGFGTVYGTVGDLYDVVDRDCEGGVEVDRWYESHSTVTMMGCSEGLMLWTERL